VKKVLLVAPVLSRSGYGEMGRFALRSMLSNPGIDLYMHNINWGKSGWIWKDNQERKLIDALLQKTVLFQQNGGQFDASVQCTIPNEWKRLTPHDVGYTAGIETDKVAGDWLVKGNEMDKIITISKHGMDVYKNTSYEALDNSTGQKIPEYKCKTPITYVGFPKKNIGVEDLDLNLRHDFNFLCVAQLGPRKNVDAVINNFIEEFKNDDVGLLLKVHGANDSVIDFHTIKKQFQNISKAAKEEGWKCSINLLHGNLSDEQMQGLYQHPKVKAMVSFTHGEGFGLPLYEAVCNGLPVVATDWSGHLDFLAMKVDINSPGKLKGGKTKGKVVVLEKKFAAVNYELKTIPKQAVWDGVLQAESKWAYVDDEDAKSKMRDVFENIENWETLTNELKESYLSEQHYYDLFSEQLGIEFELQDEEEFLL
jgi:glycosyltransferase involved in cell wall biosynthesis